MSIRRRKFCAPPRAVVVDKVRSRELESRQKWRNGGECRSEDVELMSPERGAGAGRRGEGGGLDGTVTRPRID